MISKRETSDTIDFEKDRAVMVYVGDKEAVRQPETFQFCPLGVQFYSCQPLEECTLLEFSLALPPVSDEGEEEEVSCTALVAQCCEPANGDTMYRVWVKFLDLSPETVERIQRVTQQNGFICPFCANF